MYIKKLQVKSLGLLIDPIAIKSPQGKIFKCLINYLLFLTWITSQSKVTNLQKSPKETIFHLNRFKKISIFHLMICS